MILDDTIRREKTRPMHYRHPEPNIRETGLKILTFCFHHVRITKVTENVDHVTCKLCRWKLERLFASA